jgi:Rrf2 family nitric oxide-sensitive transcriptional repressor
MYLNQEKRLVTLRELSEKLGISKNNLIKVSNQLTKLGFIHTSRGRTGGLLINQETGNKSLKDIVTKTEETFFMAECFSGNQCSCFFLPSCLLKKKISEALQAFLASLAQSTLNEVTAVASKSRRK